MLTCQTARGQIDPHVNWRLISWEDKTAADQLGRQDSRLVKFQTSSFISWGY